ncbi:MAG: type II toxin-antitoxin system VapC family toxin [Candidatus Marinimicrobia bacterium]|nr:type II toxin-antitoxin system VapC family toxin [Candidatus Neomarinimicrobiota bacterium]
MKFILDTHIFLLVLAMPEKLSQDRQIEIEIQSNRVFVSAVSIAEMMLKASMGKLTIDFDPVKITEKSGFDILDFTGEDALLLKDLPFYHKDPFDRMLIVQSISNKFKIMTDDVKFQKYNCDLV